LLTVIVTVENEGRPGAAWLIALFPLPRDMVRFPSLFPALSIDISQEPAKNTSTTARPFNNFRVNRITILL
jgi:hypothetical protein